MNETQKVIVYRNRTEKFIDEMIWDHTSYVCIGVVILILLSILLIKRGQ